jgi:pimeloyl-ACP methyl ester carboxylesterase
VTEAKLLLGGLEERTLQWRGSRLHYFVGGQGPPLALVHGFGGAATNFAALAPLLLDRYRLVIPDLPGHGGSAPLAATPSLSGFADRLAAVLEQEGAAPAAVVGHSLGGVVGLRLAARRPELVRALVLCGAAGISTTTRSSEVFVAMVSLLRPARRTARWRHTIARSPRLRSLAFDTFGTSDGAALSETAALGFLAGSRTYTDIFSAGRALVREDVRFDLAGLRCPALVVWGARDRQVPMADAFEYARRLRAPLRTIADCGHLLVGERPEACADAIDRFLGSL